VRGPAFIIAGSRLSPGRFFSPFPAAENIRIRGLVSYIVTQGISGARANWQEQLRRGALDFAILLAVSPGPKYGLAIIQYLEKFTDLVVSEGTIYPILGRLTRDELLHAWWVEDEAPHARKYYRLTPAGKRRLAEMKVEWSAFADKIARLMGAAEGSVDGAQ